MKLIVGLGNVGPQYQATRHNVGFLVVDTLARRHGIAVTKRWIAGRALVALYGEGMIGAEPVRLLLPQTMMNVSGRAATAATAWEIEPPDTLVVFDDVNLPLGALRARATGGPGGHHGLESWLAAVGSEDVPRLRVGVAGELMPKELAGYVLSEFRPQERAAIEQAIARAADACEWWVREGIEAMMNRANRSAED
jgi:PTH1 family peptidyl-tRNA hydrolase